MRTISGDRLRSELSGHLGGGAPPPDLERDVDEARAGDVPAFERIYHSIAPSVASYLRWNGVADVESVTNDVMAHVHRNLHRFSGDASGFRSWAFTIAHRRMIDERRAAARRPALVDGEVHDQSSVGNGEEDAFVALGEGRLRELLNGLSPDQRSVLLLRIVADLSLDDAAAALGKRRGAIKSLQHRALATLRRQLDEDQDPR